MKKSKKVARVVFSVAETARLVGVTEETIYRNIRKGRLEAVRIGRSISIPKSSLAKVLA